MTKDEEKWQAISKYNLESVGRVLFGRDIIGSCARMDLDDKVYIITCRHVVFDADTHGIPLYHLTFIFNKRIYSNTDFAYHDSSLGLDLSFFILNDRLCSKENVFYITEQSLYPGMRIAVTGFPSALGEGPEPLGNAPKLMTGRVTAGGAIQNIAESDIASTPPTMSGGAVFAQISDGRSLLGIHLGMYWRDAVTDRLVNGLPVASGTPSVALVKDSTFDKAPKRSSRLRETLSPEDDVESRAKYGAEDAKGKGAREYFVTIAPIVRLLAPTMIQGASKTGVISTTRKRHR